MSLAALRRNRWVWVALATLTALGLGVYIFRPAPAPQAVEAITPADDPPAAVAAPSPAEAPLPASNEQTILELFSPSDPYLTRQLNETALSQQIEQILTTSFVLTKCNLITQDEYRDTFRALIVYAQTMQLAPDSTTAEAKVRKIAESAGTSYALIYSRTKCDSPQLPVLAKQLLEWQGAYLND